MPAPWENQRVSKPPRKRKRIIGDLVEPLQTELTERHAEPSGLPKFKGFRFKVPGSGHPGNSVKQESSARLNYESREPKLPKKPGGRLRDYDKIHYAKIGNVQQYEESTMTTEEALAVAESVHRSVQFTTEEEKAALKAKKTLGLKPVRHDAAEEPKTYNRPGGGGSNSSVANRRANRAGWFNGKKDRGHRITIHADAVHFSDAQQFAEAVKGRDDAAERRAMRRAIARANIHPAVKLALLKHSAAVQFSDSGEEYPSVPMTWVLRAAKGILQMAIVPQTMDQMNHGMREKVLDSLYSGDTDTLNAVASLLEHHGLHDELIEMLHGGQDYGDPMPEDVMDQEKHRVVPPQRPM